MTDKLEALKAAAQASYEECPDVWWTTDVLDRPGFSSEDMKFISLLCPLTVIDLLAALEEQNVKLFDQSILLDAAISRAEAAEQRLQQPIKLPNYRNSPDMHTKQYFMAIGFNEGLDAANNGIRTAGFKVEGE